jgi:hypothetical protein
VADRESEAPVRVLEGPDVPDVAVLVGLDRIDYREAFAFDARVVRDPEAWLRSIMEGASPGKRAAMLRVWRWLGVGLARLDSDGQILGWRIRQSTPDVVVLAAESVSGITARIVLTATSRRVVQTMVVRYDRWFARPLWTLLAPKHRRFVRGLLADASVRSAAPHSATLGSEPRDGQRRDGSDSR